MLFGVTWCYLVLLGVTWCYLVLLKYLVLFGGT